MKSIKNFSAKKSMKQREGKGSSGIMEVMIGLLETGRNYIEPFVMFLTTH